MILFEFELVKYFAFRTEVVLMLMTDLIQSCIGDRRKVKSPTLHQKFPGNQWRSAEFQRKTAMQHDCTIARPRRTETANGMANWETARNS